MDSLTLGTPKIKDPELPALDWAEPAVPNDLTLPDFEVRVDGGEPKRLDVDPFAHPRLPRWKFMVHTVALFLSALLIGLTLLALLPQLWGWRAHVVATSEMSPALRSSDVALTSPVEPGGAEPGTIISFKIADEIRLERVVSVEADHYLTVPDSLIGTGSTVDPVDAQIVKFAEVTGSARLVVPWVGLPVVLWRDASALQLASVLVAALLVFGLSSRRMIDQRPRIERS